MHVRSHLGALRRRVGIRRSTFNRLMIDGPPSVVANAALRWRSRSRLLVLCYHGVLPDDWPGDDYRARNAVRATEFRRQLAALRRRFHPVSAWDVADWVQGKRSLPPNPALVTFDDGFRNNLTVAADELLRAGVPAVIHVATNYIGGREMLWTQEIDELVLNWPDAVIPTPGQGPAATVPTDGRERNALAKRIRYQCKDIEADDREAYLRLLRSQAPPVSADPDLHAFLSWDEVRRLVEQGFAIGSHAQSHPSLSRLCRTEIEREIVESKAVVERETGQACPWIAYPHGRYSDYSSEVLDVVRGAGYAVGFVLAGRTFTDGPSSPLELGRMNVICGLSSRKFEALISGLQTMLSQGADSRA